MGKDKVMHPVNKDRQGGAPKQVKSQMVEGPTCTSENMTAYNRSGNNKSKD